MVSGWPPPEPERKSGQHFHPSNHLKMSLFFFVMAGLVPAIHVFFP
jgi:hypothetical protein